MLVLMIVIVVTTLMRIPELYFQPIEDDFEDDPDDVAEDDFWSDFFCSE